MPHLSELTLLGRMTSFGLDDECIYLDVAHNEQAVVRLAAQLKRKGCASVRVVFGLYADKDVDAIIAAIGSMVHFWHLTQVDETRALASEQLMTFLPVGDQVRAETTNSVRQALENAIGLARGVETIVVFGSFPVVGEALEYLEHHPRVRLQ